MLSVNPTYSYPYTAPAQLQPGSNVDFGPLGGVSNTAATLAGPAQSQAYPVVEMMRQVLGQVMQFMLAVMDKVLGLFAGQRAAGSSVSTLGASKAAATAELNSSTPQTFGTQLDRVIDNASGTWSSLQSLFDFSKEGFLGKAFDGAASVLSGGGALKSLKGLFS